MDKLGSLAMSHFGPWLAATIFVSFAAYAAVKRHLVDVSVSVSRIIAEIIAVILQSSLYLILVWCYRSFVSTQVDIIFIAGTVIYIIMVGQAHRKIRIFLQAALDRIFLRGKYNYYQLLAAAGSRVGQELSLKHILGVLYDTFINVVGISSPRVFLLEHLGEAGRVSRRYLVYNEKDCQPDEEGPEVRVDDPLIGKLISKRYALRLIRQFKGDLLVPCLLENRLIGFFALGQKLSKDPYTSEDIRLLEVLASQAAMALDHARSYEKIKMDLETAEREIERSQRLASLGTLMAGVTHEVLNPLTVIRGQTERLSGQELNEENIRNFQQLIIRHIDRIAAIVQGMLGFARGRKKEEAEINLNAVIENTLPLFNFDGVKLVKDLREIPPH